MADADLPSLSYGHLGGDSAGPAQRGKQGATRPLSRRSERPNSGPPGARFGRHALVRVRAESAPAFREERVCPPTQYVCEPLRCHQGRGRLGGLSCPVLGPLGPMIPGSLAGRSRSNLVGDRPVCRPHVPARAWIPTRQEPSELFSHLSARARCERLCAHTDTHSTRRRDHPSPRAPAPAWGGSAPSTREGR